MGRRIKNLKIVFVCFLVILLFTCSDTELTDYMKDLVEGPGSYYVTANGQRISDGGSYDFGTVWADGDEGTKSSDIIFTFVNALNDNQLNDEVILEPGEVTINDPGDTDFDLSNTILAETLSPSENTSFNISFDPITETSLSAVITIPIENESFDDFTFNVTGTGGPEPIPDIYVHQGGTEMPDGSSSTYDFGSIIADGDGGTTSSVIIFTIENRGTADLILSGSPRAYLSNTTDFDLMSDTGLITISSSGSTTFQLRFDPITTGSKSSTVTLTTNCDAPENIYTFEVYGEGVDPPPLDVVLVIETAAGFYANHYPYLNNDINNIITAISTKNPDYQIGIAEFSDYFASTWGNSGDIEYNMLLDLTANTTNIINTVNAITPRAGMDFPASQLVGITYSSSNFSWRAGSDRVIILITWSNFHNSENNGVGVYTNGYPIGTTDTINEFSSSGAYLGVLLPADPDNAIDSHYRVLLGMVGSNMNAAIICGTNYAGGTTFILDELIP